MAALEGLNPLQSALVMLLAHDALWLPDFLKVAYPNDEVFRWRLLEAQLAVPGHVLSSVSTIACNAERMFSVLPVSIKGSHW